MVSSGVPLSPTTAWRVDKNVGSRSRSSKPAWMMSRNCSSVPHMVKLEVVISLIRHGKQDGPGYASEGQQSDGTKEPTSSISFRQTWAQPRWSLMGTRPAGCDECRCSLTGLTLCQLFHFAIAYCDRNLGATRGLVDYLERSSRAQCRAPSLS
ncbi:hypothetical protein BV22DRAFT_673968 [Leucogyrophana mollusca]|uniref:Uncharacterized protein n=1 Tax=Leucogyrophana mollusca TaxID=85980 RepID=A0ACB8B974_9AGAM|nr:hypothetical protein BV22DRAFT_673968 [Leucogyrophana mollusca]